MDYATERNLRRLATDALHARDRLDDVERRDGGGGAGTVALLQITGLHSDSPASGVRMYKGDLYANGSDAAATATDVTVRIPKIAADVTTPSYGAWANLPPCGAVRTTATWGGATETHTSVTVYEAVGLLIFI